MYHTDRLNKIKYINITVCYTDVYWIYMGILNIEKIVEII
jgi:hypothetical protein